MITNNSLVNNRKTPAATPKAPSKMTLANVRKGKLPSPARVLMYGMEGVGKSTFAAGAPNPIFICSESGTDYLDVARFAVPESWDDVIEALELLEKEEHPYETVVIDTLDWLEPFVWNHVIRNASPSKEGHMPRTIEEVGGGYGKGHEQALDHWRVMLKRLEVLRVKKNMNIVLVAHAWIKSFANPEGSDYDRYELKLNRKAAGLMKEWVDDMLFASCNTTTKKADNKKVKGVGGVVRLMRTERCAAFDAKNRCGLPYHLPLSWDEYAAARQLGQPSPPEEMLAEIRELVAELGQEEKLPGLLEWAGNDPIRIAQARDKVRAAFQLHQERMDESTQEEQGAA